MTFGEVTLCIRPEYVSMSRRELGRAFFEAEVDIVGSLGDGSICVRAFKAKTPITFATNPGDKVWALFEKSQIRLFDQKTGEALA